MTTRELCRICGDVITDDGDPCERCKPDREQQLEAALREIRDTPTGCLADHSRIADKALANPAPSEEPWQAPPTGDGRDAKATARTNTENPAGSPTIRPAPSEEPKR
jgi:hypothetical protein